MNNYFKKLVFTILLIFSTNIKAQSTYVDVCYSLIPIVSAIALRDVPIDKYLTPDYKEELPAPVYEYHVRVVNFVYSNPQLSQKQLVSIVISDCLQQKAVVSKMMKINAI